MAKIDFANMDLDQLLEFGAQSLERLYQLEKDMIIANERLDKSIAERDKERDKERKESDAKFDKWVAEVNKQREEDRRRFEEEKEEFSLRFGNFGNRLGEITELVVIPGVKPILSKLGYHFEHLYPNKVVKANNRIAVEVDLLLDNGECAMAVEIKTRLAASMIDSHIRRLEKLREFDKYAELQNKKIYGAIAGVIIERDVQKYALKKGLYVLEIIEDKNRLKAKAPATGHVGVW